MIPNFLFQLTDSQGNRPNPSYYTGNETQLFFMFTDMFNSFTPVKYGNFLPIHERKIHILLATEDLELMWHLHPEDYEDLASQAAKGPSFHVNITFPRSGFYMICATFLFTNGTFEREGFAQTNFYVWGSPAQNTPSFNIAPQNNFRTYNLGPNDVFDTVIDSNHNHDANGPLVTMKFLSSGMHMRRQANLPQLEADIFSMCTPFAFEVYVKNSNQEYVPATLLPFLGAPVHFTLLSDDRYVFHAHGTYIFPNMTFDDLRMEVAGMGMHMNMSNPKDDAMMNLTMNAMMIGITMNGSIDCFREAGEIIRETGMNMSYFSGPETFGPTIVGLYDFPFAGYWRIFAHMKIKLPDGRIQLIVPHFDLYILAPGARVTTGMDMQTMSMTSGHNMGMSTTGEQAELSTTLGAMSSAGILYRVSIVALVAITFCIFFFI